MVFSLLELAELLFTLAEGCVELLIFLFEPRKKRSEAGDFCWWDILVVAGAIILVLAFFSLLYGI
jgi:hypothetical protein